jgi:L-malate glycosyltransferase
MKILLMAPANNVHTIKWLNYFDQLGYEVINVSFETHYDPVPRGWKNIKREYLKLAFNNKLAYVFTIKQVKEIVKTEKPDICHSHYASSYGFISVLANLRPLIISVWGTDIYTFPRGSFLAKKIVQFTLHKSDVICATSESLKEETQKYTKNKEFVITPFGVDLNKFSPSNSKCNESDDCFTIGVTKSMEEKYGIEYLLHAYAIFKELVGIEEFDKTQLIVIGDGPLLQKYKQLVTKLKIDGRVIFKGRVPHENIYDYIKMFDVAVVPSIVEAFGVAAIEAQACGVPVIATNVGGLPEVIVNKETGYIVRAKNPKAIALKLQILKNNPELRKRMGKKAITHIYHNFNWENNARVMTSLYERVLNNNHEKKL